MTTDALTALAAELSDLTGRTIPADKAVSIGINLAVLFETHGAADVADRIRIRVAYAVDPNKVADLCEAALA